ncbi:NAD(P)/FAD-dependent oxidoreductase [methane-oxidizing endosymbiont of Gigantopelta aegis]|uniref:NAD(P)/FAD-dependent oxidoreductase n=1 Tax=methane-oxidizing endosymbiont of Gigantopelta aegis TaxID=2794938 RepID=UPI0018DC17B2|nr:tryptophan 7-halogenase [methane-oxidizing endosymbiont of Gigantopelta aegis]
MSESGHIAIIGAGPAGAIAAACLLQKGHRVTLIESQQFPRFSIGESLLPQCMEFIEQAGMLPAVEQAGFQLKSGAAFLQGERQTEFCFSDKFGHGFDSTFQVQRDRFDHVLAHEAEKKGAEIRWRQRVIAADFDAGKPCLMIQTNSEAYRLEADFVLDASGFGRVLPRLLGLEKPSNFPIRQSMFSHCEDRIRDSNYDRNLIRIIVHPECRDVWYWLIPFSNGRVSVGVVAEPGFFDRTDTDAAILFQDIVQEEPGLAKLLENAVWDTPVNSLTGYSANVSRLFGPGYALLGNAGEFLDPVFSSGVTIAMKSAVLAADAVDLQLNGEAVDWQKSFAEPLQKGVDVFRTFVRAWYEGGLQDVIFYQRQQANIKQMICAILAGYVWDEENPYVKNAEPRLKTLVELCRL